MPPGPSATSWGTPPACLRRLVSRTAGNETTAYEYDPVGSLIKTTFPDGSFLAYDYDDAHRLVSVADSLGNRIDYTLDGMGNRTREEVRDPAGALAQARTREYSNLNRLAREIGAAGQVTQYAYDPQGNLTALTDPLNKTTTQTFDALNRLATQTDPAAGVTRYALNPLDQLTGLTDPRNLTTSYALNALDELARETSPDAGMTDRTFDAAGNVLTRTDARGQSAAYTYDALNRVTRIQ
jgi:YD repeat-containing protein